ncbi:MAG TPA: UDP-N-acetylmuramate--L-alanine ligase [Actinotalea sp.]|nr:UDP-N-acetylmuramate--L-alanine ligase [Actinotalea sp.]
MSGGEVEEDVAALAARGRVHLVGVGGAGMSAIAALLAARGLVVSGSDARAVGLERLAELGVVVHVGHDAAHVEGAGTVVVSTAIRESNPELARARGLGIPVRHRSQALAALMAGRRAIAVAGAHGKTTTSAMVAVLLGEVGLDPSFAIGGSVLSASGSLGGAHHGTGDVFVAEADESDGSFLAYRPQVAVVTNVEPDHLDHYGSREAFERAFVDFVGRIAPDGWLVACADDPGARDLVARARAAGTAVRTYGTASDADVRLGPWHPVAGGGWTTVREGEGPELRLELAVPGAHNGLNAAAAWTVARLLGVDGAAAARGLAAFVGTGRRFEDRGSAGGVRVVDDYAHHPTEVAALLTAARAVAGSGRVLVLFQPHLYSRTRTFAEAFARALALADVVVVTAVYAAREDPDPAVTGALIADRVPGGRYVADKQVAAATLARAARPGDLLLTVGAGDVTDLAPVVLATLAGTTGGDA